MGRTFTTADGDTTRDLLLYARHHLASARVLFDRSPYCYDSAGYLSHLGIELLLKAALLHYAGGFPNEHDLGKLLGQVQAHRPSLTLDAAQLETLERVDGFNFSRYPAPTTPVVIGSEDWPAIEALWKTIVGALPQELMAQGSTTIRTPDGESVVEKGGRVLMRKAKGGSS